MSDDIKGVDRDLLLRKVNIDHKEEKFRRTPGFGPPESDVLGDILNRKVDLLDGWDKLATASKDVIDLISNRSSGISIPIPDNLTSVSKFILPGKVNINYEDYLNLVKEQSKSNCGNPILEKRIPGVLGEPVNNTNLFSKPLNQTDIQEYLLLILLFEILERVLGIISDATLGSASEIVKPIIRGMVAAVEALIIEKEQTDSIKDMKNKMSYSITRHYEQEISKLQDENSLFASYLRDMHDNIETACSISRMIDSYNPIPSKDKENVIAQIPGPFLDDPARNFNIGIDTEDILGSTFQEILDCINCDLRITLAGQLDISDNILNILENELKSRQNYLNNIVQQLFSVDIYSDLCLIIKAFRRHCLPDLGLIVTLLQSYMMALTEDHFSLMDFSIDIVWPFVRNMLLQLLGILQQLIDMVLGPIDCIRKALTFDILKETGLSTAPGPTGLSIMNADESDISFNSVKFWQNLAGFDIGNSIALRQEQAGDQVPQPGLLPLNSSIQKLAGINLAGFDKLSDVIANIPNDLSDGANNILNDISKYIDEGATELSSMFTGTFGEVLNIFIAKEGKRDSLTKIIEKKIRLIRMIGIIKALSSGKSLDNYCEDDPDGVLIGQLIDNQTDQGPVDITIEDGEIVITPKNKISDSQLKTIMNALDGSSVTFTDPSINTKRISIPSCLSTTTESEEQMVKRWITELNDEQ